MRPKSLPEGWVEARLSDVTQINPPNPEIRPDDDALVSFVPMAAVRAMGAGIDTSETRPWRTVRKGYKRFQDGDVLFAKITPCMENGKLAVATGLRNGVGAGSTEFHVLRPSRAIRPDLLAYYLLRDDFRASARARMTGTAGQLRVPQRFLETRTLLVPPLDEQRRIVDAVDSYFRRLDDVTATLERVRRSLERYRATILKVSVGGVSTGSWTKVPLSKIAEVRLGRQRSPKRAVGPNMRPYMRAANVTWNGISLHDVKEMDFTPAEVETYALRPGDLLLSEASGTASEVGKPAIWNGQVPDCCFQNTLIRVRARESLVPFLHLHFYKDALTGEFARAARGVGIHHLGAKTLSEWKVHLPPPEEQRRIVEVVDSQFKRLDKVAATLGRANLRATTLRQSVLKRAFDGALTDRD